jgi:DNA-binding CsgD family transcriptional regulator/PAS domain-containing protein
VIDSEVLGIIGLIYDAVIQPKGWATALETIRMRHGWHNSSLSVVALPAQSVVIQVALNIPDSMYEQETMMSDVVAIWGGAERLAKLPLEEPFIQSEQTDPATWWNYKFFTDWGVPEGIIDQVGIVLARDRTTHALLGFAQHKSMADRPEWVMDELRVLAPHLRRAATISRLLERSEERAATFEAALDAAASGAVLVRGDMEIVHANAAADTMLRSGDPIQSSNGRLRLSEELVPGHLDAAVTAAAAGAGAMGRRGIGIPARRRDGSPLVTHVMPLEARMGGRADADAIVFIADSDGAEPLAGESLELLFGLTPAEVRAFELVATGRPSRAIASEMGVAESTLRTHLLRVYDKTGRHSRAGLVQLARELKLPV